MFSYFIPYLQENGNNNEPFDTKLYNAEEISEELLSEHLGILVSV